LNLCLCGKILYLVSIKAISEHHMHTPHNFICFCETQPHTKHNIITLMTKMSRFAYFILYDNKEQSAEFITSPTHSFVFLYSVIALAIKQNENISRVTAIWNITCDGVSVSTNNKCRQLQSGRFWNRQALNTQYNSNGKEMRVRIKCTKSDTACWYSNK